MSTVTTFLNLVKPAPLEQFSRATYNTNLDLIDAGILARSNWDKYERLNILSNAGFAWSGGMVGWDAGVLSQEAGAGAASQISSPTPTFVTAGSVSGSLKFLEAGIYEVAWWVVPNADPGQSGYRIGTYGTWPGSPGGVDSLFAQTIKHSSGVYWETPVIALNIRIPTANLEVRLTGQQTNATTNAARVRIAQKGKF